jgi:hypothetical protein
MEKKSTRKKVKVIGVKEFIDRETGEVIKANVTTIEERDANFHKIWLTHIIHALDLAGNVKVKLITFILKNLDKENKLVMTQRQIAENSGFSLGTTVATLKLLKDADFITKINTGAYRIHPDKIWKGGSEERMNVLLQYTKERANSNREV